MRAQGSEPIPGDEEYLSKESALEPGLEDQEFKPTVS